MEADSCGQLTLGTVVLLFGTLASLPPPPLQYLQPVILLQLEDGQRDLISERRAWQMTGENAKDNSKWWRMDKRCRKMAQTREGLFPKGRKKTKKHEM